MGRQQRLRTSRKKGNGFLKTVEKATKSEALSLDYGDYCYKTSGNKPLKLLDVKPVISMAPKDLEKRAYITCMINNKYPAILILLKKFFFLARADFACNNLVEVYPDRNEAYFASNKSRIVPFKLTLEQIKKYEEMILRGA